jgi:restriction endonuclease Mrr
MTIPDFQSMMRPVLALHADGLPHTAADVRNDVAAVLGVTEEERQVPLPSGRTNDPLRQPCRLGGHPHGAGPPT